jgi:NADH-quinone oxidoreductase subunit N
MDQQLFDYSQIAWLGPLLIMSGTVMVLLLADILARAFKMRDGLSMMGNVVISVLGSLAAGAHAVYLLSQLRAGQAAVELFTAVGPVMGAGTGTESWRAGAVVADGFALYCALVVSAITVMTCLILVPFLRQRGLFKLELFPLLLISACGMILLPYSRDLLITFIGIEIVSLPIYVLCGLSGRNQLNQESSLKYFLIGAFASGFYIYGAALVYGMAGNLNYRAIASYLQATGGEVSGVLLGGMALVGVGLAFKIALVPFQAWLPDVYQGAPTPITAFMATGIKLAVFAAALRIVAEAFGPLDPGYWRDALSFFAVASMVVGNLFALHQMSAKRLLAYSAITHTGYLAVGLCVGTATAAPGILVYLISYCLASFGAFALIGYLAPGEQDDIYLDEMHELSKRAPAIAAALTVLFLSMLGMPFTAGFVGKLLVFTDAWAAGLHGLVIIAVLNSAVSAYFYLRFLTAMYLQPRAPGPVELHPAPISRAYALAAIVAVALTIVFGFLPEMLVGFSRANGGF